MPMVFYMLLIVQLFHRPSRQPLFRPFKLGGRMPLTNYLMQTAICTTLFCDCDCGFGLWAQIGPAAGLSLSLAIFLCVQVHLSLWWLKHHERGPLEVFWARSAYGRRDAQASAAEVGPTLLQARSSVEIFQAPGRRPSS